MEVKELLDLAVTVGKNLSADEGVKNWICGEYTDGSTRSLIDAMRGESISPKQWKKLAKYEKKQKKKHKKKKKYKYPTLRL